MGMLTDEDLKQIGGVMDDKLVDVLDAVNKGFSGVQGQMNGLTNGLSDLSKDLSELTKKVTGIEAVMVTKDDLHEKMIDMESRAIARERRLEIKTDVLVDALVENHTLTASNVERLEQARVFPRITP